MEEEQYNLIDGILTTKGFKEDRQAALDLLEVGVREGTLGDVAEVIARRYALQPQAVVEWFGEVLNRRIKEAQEIIESMKQLGVTHDGS